MIIIDTHIWVWWNQGDSQLSVHQRDAIEDARTDGIGVCTISLIEVARLLQRGRIILPKPIHEWFNIALAQQGVILISITPAIAIDASNLPGSFHKDPADRIIVATARAYDCPLITVDREILAYSNVKLL
jgi:PIN domain nuclease of toxin-antitoxin system